MSRAALGTLAPTGLLLAVALPALGHSGPPFPIVSDRVVATYRVSIWTDPDVTEDRTPAGKFWVIVHTANGADVPAGTRVFVSARPLDRTGAQQGAPAAVQQGVPSRYFSNLILDHEGKWKVDASFEGPLGTGTTSADVDATYDLRPSVGVLPFLLLPFLLVGLLWLKALRMGPRKRRPGTGP